MIILAFLFTLSLTLMYGRSTSSTPKQQSSEDLFDHLIEEARQLHRHRASPLKAYMSYVRALSAAKAGSAREQESLLELSQFLESQAGIIGNNVTAIEFLLKAAEQGHAEAQHRLSAVYGTGVYTGIAPIDAGRALLLEHMAAISGHAEANMGMGFRYLYGIGVPESCEMAKMHYEVAANIAVNRIQRRGYELFIERARLSDIEATQEKSDRSSFQSEQESIDYLAKLTNEGDAMAAARLVEIYVLGSRYCIQDLNRALNLMRLAASRGSYVSSGQLGYLASKAMLEQLRRKKQLEVESEVSRSNKRDLYVDYYDDDYDNDLIITYPFISGDELESKSGIGASSPVGRQPRSSDSIQPSESIFEKVLAMVNGSEAMSLLHLSASHGDPYGLVGLGIVYYRGIFGATVNLTRAMDYFAKAVSRHPDASYYMGEIYMGQHLSSSSSPFKFSPTTASEFYSIAAQRRHLMAHYKLSHMSASGIGAAKVCQSAVNGFKAVAERGDWMYSLTRAMRLYLSGQKQAALLIYSRLAAVGVEVAQFNAGYILSKIYCPPTAILQSQYCNPSGYCKSPIDSDLDNNYYNNSDLVLIKSRRLKLKSDVKFLNVDSSNNEVNVANTPTSFLSKKKVVSVSVGTDPWAANISLAGKSASLCQKRGYGLLTLSGHQGIADAWLLLGDFHYYGAAELGDDKVMAVYYYQKAADLKHTHALFNLGIMYENGDGVEQDFHLAKRYFDEAAEYDPQKGFMPKVLALFILQWHIFMINNFGGDKTRELFNWFLPHLRFRHAFMLLDHTLAGVIDRISPSYSISSVENTIILVLILTITYLRGYRDARRQAAAA